MKSFKCPHCGEEITNVVFKECNTVSIESVYSPLENIVVSDEIGIKGSQLCSEVMCPECCAEIETELAESYVERAEGSLKYAQNRLAEHERHKLHYRKELDKDRAKVRERRSELRSEQHNKEQCERYVRYARYDVAEVEKKQQKREKALEPLTNADRQREMDKQYAEKLYQNLSDNDRAHVDDLMREQNNYCHFGMLRDQGRDVEIEYICRHEKDPVTRCQQIIYRLDDYDSPASIKALEKQMERLNKKQMTQLKQRTLSVCGCAWKDMTKAKNQLRSEGRDKPRLSEVIEKTQENYIEKERQERTQERTQENSRVDDDGGRGRW